MGWDANAIPWVPETSFPGPKHCHPCFPISKAQLISLSRGNLAHSARVTRPTKAAQAVCSSASSSSWRCLSHSLILSLLLLFLLTRLSPSAPYTAH